MVRLFIRKVLKDSVTMLASVVAWGVLSSIIPILVALIAISGLALHDPVKQQVIVASLSRVLQNVLTTADLRALVHLVVDHTGLLGVLGAVGMLWGASNFGGAIATVFQPIFQVRGRPLLQQKLIDVGMIFVFTVRMVVIVAATTAGALLHRVLSTAPLTDASSFIVGTTVSLLAAYLLFFVIYAVFPNIEHRFRAGHIWKGAGIAALLFQVLSYIWPLYVVVFHPQRYGGRPRAHRRRGRVDLLFCPHTGSGRRGGCVWRPRGRESGRTVRWSGPGWNRAAENFHGE